MQGKKWGGGGAFICNQQQQQQKKKARNTDLHAAEKIGVLCNIIVQHKKN